MAVRERRNIYHIPIVDTTIDWYSRAVEEMMRRDADDPTSWTYRAAVHGLDRNFGNPFPGTDRHWRQCAHRNWFFLPWHRGYVASFEAMVAKIVEELGGPSEWALPYWDYSESLTTNPEAHHIPPAFRDEFFSDGVTPNPLWRPRSVDANGRVFFDPLDISLGALAAEVFTDPNGFLSGLGGNSSGFGAVGDQTGELESLPHNNVHGRIGGAMGSTLTAALDPIFWLHHCNIDRLWEEWLVANPFNINPIEDAWRTDEVFPMHDADGNEFTFTSADTEDTTSFMHGYKYDTVLFPPFADPFGPFGPFVESQQPVPAPQTPVDPELAASSDAPVALGAGTTRAAVKLQTEGLNKSFTESALPTPQRVFLRLENVRGTGIPSDFAVMIDIDGDAVEPLQVGLLTTFGLAEASDPEGEHGGAGVSQLYEITYAAERLQLTEANTSEVQVFFREIEGGPKPEAADLARFGIVLPDDEPSVEVGRIAIYFE